MRRQKVFRTQSGGKKGSALREVVGARFFALRVVEKNDPLSESQFSYINASEAWSRTP